MGALRRVKTKRRTRYALFSSDRRRALSTSTNIPSSDYDQVLEDISSAKHLKQYKETKDAEDLPALGAHFCVECSKWFESEHNLVAHRKGKNHKRRFVISFFSPFVCKTAYPDLFSAIRLRLLKEEPHSQKVAEAAIGLTTNNGVRSANLVVPEAIDVDEDL